MTIRKLNVVMICAHPDEPDMYAGGLAALYAEQGHNVRFLSLTNGDSGHYALTKPEIAARRRLEADRAADVLGLDAYDILETSDGELEPTLAVRKEVIRYLRQHEPDVLVAFHPEGGVSPDNRYAGRVVADAVPYAGVPGFMPDIPSLRKRMLVLLMPDMSLQTSYRPDVAICTDSVLEKKLLACDAHSTTFYELIPWGAGKLDAVPKDWPGRRQYLMDGWSIFGKSDRMLPALELRYGKERAAGIASAEAFEIARYGLQPSDSELDGLLPKTP
ncbi:PIG-L deacetylase family protein [Cohnella hashimotonis]|uniref:PIG-L family deacetylase n=1 Tax=Cohnella hashimotonis TaxID=2826895 RepID=A0ABT6TCE5_9BACL|nr:PIG-L family deacetylase [Cohnella hashimotonis]MDI4643497.1 PIG-L family deacetylase [Cohnella hashimotonis]